ncbi:AarF/ABC1/UbiB kinase family protein [Conexibacter sp. SYSU D00693]|uniref:ABC1 kinase family protein n=1 Tax=Conexibacter sp. SYSU D00693 TaxID=2812560 RepID=UPI00196B0D72|nr:AarF/ABC1/UbiB kinase family protein [Conexibacter sp. SYSU D00693]
MPKVPRSRIARTAKFGSMVAGQGVRRLTARSDERRGEWAMGAAEELVATLGQMKGAAMKLGQVLSTVDFDLVPEEHREEFKAKLAALRDQSPQVAFKDMRRVVEQDTGEPLHRTFAEFDEQAIAAASIGQVYRARTHDGRDVAVKVQYPGVAEAVETDLRNAGMLIPLVRRMAPGLDARALLAELRDRIGEELDYELEAQHQRAVARAFRGHPFVVIPQVDTSLSSRRMLVSEYVPGTGFEAVKARPEAERDRFAEICFRFFYGLLERERLVAGDPHPGNYLLADDGRVCFLDFGLMRKMDQAYLDAERALARAVVAGDAAEVHRGLAELGYLPDPDAFVPEDVLGQLQAAGEWYFTPGFRRLDPEFVRQTMETSSSPRSAYFDQMRRQTIPPQALLLRRMEGLLFGVLGELRAGGDWGTLALEYIAGAPPSTELGREEAAWLGEPVAAP